MVHLENICTQVYFSNVCLVIETELHSHCSIVMPACTVLLLCCNHFIDLYCHMFIPTHVTLEFVTQVKGIVLRILYTHACCDRRVAWGAKVKHLRQLAIMGSVS